MLKEDFLSIAIPVVLIGGAILKFLRSRKLGYEPSENVINAINDIWNDREFVTAFVKIIDKVSNFEELINKINKNLLNDRSSTKKYRDAELWWVANQDKYKIDINIQKVISQLEKTPQYKSMAKKHNFTADDIKDFRKVLYITITRNDVVKRSKEILNKSIEKAIKSQEFIKTGDLSRTWQMGG